MSNPGETLFLIFAMGAVIFFCRAFPFLFFSGSETQKKPEGAAPSPRVRGISRAVFFRFVEKTVPPAAMTVLAFNSLGTPFLDNCRDGLLILIASVFTALIHLWRRNPLISIFGGTAFYMILTGTIV
ncbi:MAG: AzlD domain-containing protein [Treponema sp.]|jgi:branched-subunit amino acid transport protein AzlD|nr:AzlD domain-containing protein [Treponema sp.]